MPGKGKYILQSLRFLIFAAICLTILKPEWVIREKRFNEPEIVVLHDRSASMQTVDVPAGDSVISRKKWLENALAGEFWKPLETHYKVLVESFGAPDEKSNAPQGTDLNAALQNCLEKYRNLRALILISDGDWNIGDSPTESAAAFRTADIPVFPVGTGSKTYLPDLDLEFGRAPSFCMTGERVAIPFRIANRFARRIHTRILLKVDSVTEVQKKISIRSRSSISDNLMWNANTPGMHVVKLEAEPVLGEKRLENNTLSFRVDVRREQLKVLLVESLPRWEYRYLRNALYRDPGVEVHCLLFHQEGMKRGGGDGYIREFPDKKEKLSEYDVVFLGDVGITKGQLTREQAELIKGLVESQGSGLAFMPGSSGHHLSLLKSPLKELIPVVLDESDFNGHESIVESRMHLTSSGRGHLLTLLADTPEENGRLWKNLPGFYWNTAVIRAKPGASVLAVHSSMKNEWGNTPLLVTRPAGNGNILFMGTDSAWRWRKGVEDLYHYRFWGQVVRWMAHKRHMAHKQGIRVFYTPENPEINETVFFNVNVFTRAGFPVSEDKLTAVLSAEGVPSEQLVLTPVKDGWGVYKGNFLPRTHGTYTLAIDSAKTGQHFSTQINVRTKTIETVGYPARFKPLQHIARISNGLYFSADSLDQTVKRIQALPTEVFIERRLRLWAEWWWALSVILILALFWTARKIYGTI